MARLCMNHYPHCYYVKQKMTWYKKNGLVLKKTSKLASKYKYLGKCFFKFVYWPLWTTNLLVQFSCLIPKICTSCREFIGVRNILVYIEYFINEL